jgi:hypothetical protein
MKKLLITAAAVLATLSSFAQGTVNFSNATGTTAQRVRIDDPNTGALAPAGTTYSLGLYYAADGTSDESMFVMLGASTGVAGAAGTPTGLYNGGNRTAPTATAGGFGMFQVRGWETAYGATYELARASGQGRVGKSNIVRVDTGDPTTVPPGTPASLTAAGISGFALTPVPEPSAIALGILGAGTLLLLRRRK